MKPAGQRLLGILISLILVMATFVMFSSLVMPAYRDVQALRGELAGINTILEEEQASVQNVEKLLAQYDSIATIRQSLDLRLPAEENVASAINQIQGIASMNGMLINSLSIRPLPIEAGVEARAGLTRPIGSLRILTSMTGGYESLKTFLEDIETNIRVIDVHSLRVLDGGSNGPYRYEIEMDTYYQI